MVKKAINDPNNIVQEMIEGFLNLYPGKFKQLDGISAIVKTELDPEKVGLLVGGGSGHEPIFIEFIGKGYPDAVAQGHIFAAPSPDIILAATKAIDRGKGVLYVYGNYAGDNLNFDMAAELAEFEGIETATVRVYDDVASAPLDRITDRRGIAGDFFVIKIAGAACDAGLDLAEVKRVTEKARDNTRTMGVAFYPGTIPGEDTPAFTLPDDEIEIGLGLHGEPGVRRGKMAPADQLVDEMMDLIVQDLPYKSGDEVCLLIDSFGSTTRMEEMVVLRRTVQNLNKLGIKIHDSEAGAYATCQEMAGFSITLMKLDDELKKYFDWPVWSPVYSNIGRSTLDGR